MVIKITNQIYYYVSDSIEQFKIHKCKLIEKEFIFPTIRLYTNEGLNSHAQSYDNRNLFNNEKDAEKRKNYLNKLYYNTFKYNPYVKEDLLVEYIGKFIYIEEKINNGLKDHPKFNGIDFTDVSAGGIQIRGHHKEIKDYSYGNQPTIKYDFSNYKKCIDEFIEMWKEYDTPERVESKKRFIAAGEKWGWD